MTRPVAWALGAIIVIGPLVWTDLAGATLEPAIEWSSGDHDIYQSCDRVSNPKPSLDRYDPRNRQNRTLTPSPDPANRSEDIVLLLWFLWFGDLLIR